MANPLMDSGGKSSKPKTTSWQRARDARQQYTSAGKRGGNSRIVKSLRRIFSPTKRPQQPKRVAGFSYNVKRGNKLGGGQFQGAAKAVNTWREQNKPRNISEYAQYAAKADTAKDKTSYNFYNRNRLSQNYHNEAIAVGNDWMTDQKKYTNWILSAATPEESNRRIAQAEEYFKNSLHSVPTYDPDTHTYSNQMQYKTDAELPPWIQPTQYNRNLWEYYTTYSHDVVQVSADAYRHALDEGRERARNPYKSAFADSEAGGQIDSFLDIAIQSFDKRGFDATYEKLLNNSITYWRDYVWNPIKTGHLKTAAGNALWNLMDTMDVASRGVRALVAGETVLGGSGGREFKAANSAFDNYYAKTWEKYGLTPSEEYENNKYHGKWSRINDAKFKGQNVYWANIEGYDLNNEEDLAKIQKAQTLFMDNGGLSLLLGMHQGEATKAQLASGEAVTDATKRAEIERRLDKAFAGSDIDWRDIYNDIDQNYYSGRGKKDIQQGLKNLKAAYTDVDANFNADTGNMAADMIIETVLDPGLIVGGLAKNGAAATVKSAARNGVEEGFGLILRDADEAKRLVNNNNVRRAIDTLISSNEGKNIIFKDAKKFSEDIDLFMMKVGNESPIFSTQASRDNFKRAVTAHLMGKNTSINGTIIASENFARNALDSKAFKSMYYLDKAIDGIDSAIVKSSFFLPWAGLKGTRALGNAAINTAAKSELIQKAAARIGLRKANALREVIDPITNNVNVTKVSDLMSSFESGVHHEKDVRAALQLVVDKYDEVAWGVNDIIGKFSKGEITDEEAFRMVGELISDMTGGQYRYVQELAGYVDSLAIRYSGDIKSAYGRVSDVFKRLQNLVDHRSESAVTGFLDKVRQAKDTDELMRLFRENMDNPFIISLREQVLDNAQFNMTLSELDEIVDSVRTGRFSDQHIDSDLMREGIKAQSKISDKTLRRTVGFETFENMLEGLGVNWKETIRNLQLPDNDVSIFEKKISEFMKAWSGQKYVTYNTDDMLKFVDRFERQIQFRELLKVDTVSEVSALAAHRMVGQFNKLRKQLKRLDLVNLKDVKVITLPQMDRMAMNVEFRNNADIQHMYGSFYDDVIAPIWKEFRGMASDEVDLVDSSLFKDIDVIARQKYGFDRTSQLIEEVKTLPGFSDEHLHSFLNTLATDFRFRDDIGNIDLTPGGLRRKIEANLRTQTGESKVGMKNITDALQSIGSSNPSGFLKNYVEEFAANPTLEARYYKYVNKDVLDPTAYVEKQMLFTALADPSVIPEWNALAAKGQTPIAMHINTTGLNTEINSMTSISFRKWVPIEISDENPLTLERILDAMDEGETTVFQRYMNDAEFGEYTEQVIRKLDIKDANVDNIMDRLKGVYGIPDGGTYKSERQMVEEVCSYINDATIIKDEGLRSVAPTLLVHDLDGFNVNYLNNKIFSMANTLDQNSKTYDYINRVAKSAKDNSCNTYTRLAEQVGDMYYTDEQIDMITDLVHDYIDDINHFANGYKFNDMQSYSRRMHKLTDELKLKENANQLTEREKRFLDKFREVDGDNVLGAYDTAVKNVTDLGLYPRQFAFLSSDIDENLTKVAMDATGRTAVNTGSRIYVDDVLSYFNLETEDGFYAPIEDLRKMNEVAQYVIRTRNRQIVAGAEEFLLPHKADFDRVIQSVINLAKGNSYEATKLSYLQNMKIPDNAVDSYLMAKKLYSDHLKYWLDTDNLASLRTEGKDLDSMKLELRHKGDTLRNRANEYSRLHGKKADAWFKDPTYKLEEARVSRAACDYVNNNRLRFFDELAGGGFDINSRAQEVYDALENAADDQESRIWSDFKASSKEAKEAMLGANKSEWSDKYTPFKDFLEEYYQPAFDAIEEGLEDFRKAKAEKWEYFFKDVQPERDRLDRLIQEARADGNYQLVKELRQQRSIINGEWQAYNLNYMVEWFDNISRDKVFEELRFKDKSIQAEYEELLRQEKALRGLSKERGENYAIAAKMIQNELAKLAPKAENFGPKRKAWMQWHGDHTLITVKKALMEELSKAKRGQLDPAHSILAFEDADFAQKYKSFVDAGSSLDAIKESTKERYLDYRELLEHNYEDALLNSEMYMLDAQADYEIFHTRLTEDPQELLNALSDNTLDNTRDTLDLLQGAHEAEIYNWAAKSDFEKQVLTYKSGVMKSGLDKATHYMEAGSQLKSDMRQLHYMDEYFATAGIIRRQDRMTASVYAKAKQLFDILGGSDYLKRDSFHDFLQKASRTHRLHLQQYRLNSLRNADGVFDRTKLLSDLVYNGFNMSVFNAYNYTPKEMDELLGFVKDLQKKGDDFLSYYEDRTTGNVFIYLNDNAVVEEADGVRWINKQFRFERPVHEVVPFAEFDELAKVLDIDDIEDFRGVYAHLRSCWEDTRILSMGQINGTTGKTISRKQAESFLQSLPSNMNDWLTSEGLLQDELTRGVIYDPGFVINEESDMLTDFLGTLQRQAETAKDDAVLINEVFHSTGSVQFSELAQNFTTEELVEYFGENPEYVVCTITGNANTATGLQVKQLNLSNAVGVEMARNMQNTTILPYSTYYEIANYMNRDVSDNVYKKLLGKYMLVYKAFSLVKPGTWMRNFIDATSKAAFDNGEGAGNVINMLQYEGKAARDIGTYGRIIASDPKLLNPANWDIVQRTFQTDMTFEDFELLRGVMDANRYKSADKYFLSRTARRNQGLSRISGENVGLRNLDEKDIKAAYGKYLSKEADLPLSENEFLEIYKAGGSSDPVINEQYEDMFRKLSNNLRSGNAGDVFDKTIDTMFKPFGQVEELVRYAQTLMLRDQGLSQNQITRHIHNTQFYNAPTWGTWHKLETIMPFITFKYNNMMYWVRMMDENPRLFRYFEDTYRSVYETTLESALEEGVELDYENDYGLQSGAIPIGNGKYYFNLGNSFLSAMNDFYGFPQDINSLNPLIRDSVRASMYVLGLNSKQFFSDLNLELTDEDAIEHVKQMVPGYDLTKRAMRTFKNIAGMSTSENGPSMDALYSTMNFLGMLGIRYQYRDKSGRFSMEDYQEELAAQGKWYDYNLGEVVDISQKNEYGANDPNNSWADVQSYMLTHFGKIWDANQRKFVTMDQYQEGGYNDGFDFDNDPEAWKKLCAYMSEQGKVWDYNQRKFVYREDVIAGGLNDPTIDWDTKVTLMEEKFPNLIWDANQQAFVEKRFYIRGGMNDFSQYEGSEFLRHWNELKSLRLALYGETYDSGTHKFSKTEEPSIILWDRFMGLDDRKKYDNYYTMLGIPRLMDSTKPLHVNNEGMLVTEDGKYVLTGNSKYDQKVFDKFRHIYTYGGRSYHRWKNYSYRKTFGSRKPYKGRSLAPTYYTGFGWNSQYGYYRKEFEYSYQYHSPQPGAKLNRLINPPKFYPYGGGYNKFSFQNHY